MSAQIQVTGKQNYGACEPCPVKQVNGGKKSGEEEAEKGQFGERSLKVVESKRDPRLSSVLSKSALMHKSWPPLTASSGTQKTTTTPGNGPDEPGNKKNNKTLLERAADVIPCLGIMLALCASVFLGSAGMLVKMTQSVHGIQVAVFRAVIQLFIYGSVIKLRGLPCLPEAHEFMPVMGRALLGASSITCSYCALKLIPLGDATTIRFSLPIWTLIISYLVLNESCSLFKIFAVVISISGVVLIAKPDDCLYLFNQLLHALKFESEKDYENHLLQYELYKTKQASEAAVPLSNEPYRQFEGSLLALASSICLSLSLVALRLCKHTPAEITILWLSIISIGIGSVTLLALQEWRLPDNWMDVLYIFLNGLCGSIGQWFITSALKIEQSGIISLARTFDIEVAFLYSAFVLHENIRMTSIVGSVLVSCGVIAVVVPKWLKTDESDELADDEDEDYDDGVEQRNDNNNTNININHSPHSHAPEMPQLPANNDNKIRHQLADNNNNNNNNDEESSSQDCRLSASKTASSNCQPSRDEKTQA